MKRIRTAALALLMIGSAGTIHAQAVKEELNVPLSSPGKPFKLKVGLVTGSIRVTGGSGNSIQIGVTAPDGGKKAEVTTESGMKRISGPSGFEVTAREDNNSVVVNTGSPNRRIDLDIKVPAEGRLVLSTVNGGDIKVENVKGELEVTNVNGDVELTGINGYAVATTINGHVIAKFTAVNPEASMAFSSLNGRIDVSFPANVKYNIKAKSDRGQVYSDFDIDVDKTQPKINRTSEGGLYKIDVDDWVYGKINGGGQQIMLKNMNGSIYIRKNK